MPVPPDSIFLPAHDDNHAIPIEIRIARDDVWAAAGRDHGGRRFQRAQSWVRATLTQSSRTPATPKRRVFSSMGQMGTR